MADPGPLPELDPIVHGQLRLAILSLLAGTEEADFRWLREKTRATDGNLGANLAKLEQAKYVGVTKQFVAKKPNSVYRLTPAGRAALASYVEGLRRLLGDSLYGSPERDLKVPPAR